MKKLLILSMVSAAAFCLSCSQWRVSELASSKLVSMDAGNDPGKIALSFNKDDFPEMTAAVSVGGSHVFVADNSKQKRLYVFDKSNTLKTVVSGKKEGSSSVFSFGMIGDVAEDSDGIMYVQNKLDTPVAVKTPAAVPDQDGQETGRSPSFVVVFDSSGKLQYSMGQKGSSDTPFYRIESLFVDSEDRLWVICKNNDTWSVFRFKNRVRDFYTSFGKESFGVEKDGSTAYSAVLENVVPYNKGKAFLISIAYYSNTRFKYRKIMECTVSDNRTRTLLQIPDPRNELFAIMDDKYLLLWDTEEKNLKFAIWDLEGNVVNHLRIKFGKTKSYYTKVFADEKGKIYSFSIKKNGLDVLEWK